MFSKACEYSIRASIFIAGKSMDGQRTNLKEIAEAIDSPVAYTAKLLQQLVHAGVIDSVKGVSGGFEIPKNKIGKLKLCHIVDAMGLPHCSEKNPCPVHDHFKSIRQDLKNMLEKTDLKELTEEVKDGKALLKR
jgi:Rrf2 family protein